MDNEPTFDVHGYPSEETLKTIKDWDITDHATLPAFIAKAWHWPDRACEVRPGLWVFATGGWSGNESLLSAMERSMAWYMLSWDALYVPGGLQIIAVSKDAKQEMDALHSKITEWAWAKKAIPIIPPNKEYPQ